MNRIPTLDGWRGIAILLVMFDHTQRALTGGYLHPWLVTGQHGVTVFFVLSGFLITTKLLEGPIDLRSFYTRRFFRLIPVAWAYLIAVWLFGRLYGVNCFSFQDVASCVFFFRNLVINPHLSIFTIHFWSLSMEEQFYIVWPCILLLAGARKAGAVAGAGALACAVFRFTHWSHYNRMSFAFETQVRVDALLIGCLLGLSLHNPAIRRAAVKWSKVCALPAFCVLLACIAAFQWLPPLVECIAIAALIAASTLHPDSLFARPLSLRPLAWLGTVSYSLYVWQQFFFITRSHSATIAMMCVMPLFALGSYYFIERPATRFGRRLTSVPAREVAEKNPAVILAKA